MEDNNYQLQQRTGKDIHWTMKVLNEVVESTASITNDAKRIKAILLHRHECGLFAYINKGEIASAWSKMEYMLHNMSFWKFINPNPDNQLYADYRMNYIIEILLRCEKDGNGNFVEVSTLLQQNPHYLSERCLPIMLDMEADKVPFLRCDLTLDELMEEELLVPNSPHEISPGMFALWMAIKISFGHLWAWYATLAPDPTEGCFAADINGVRGFLAQFIMAKEEDLIPTGKTLGEYLEEEEFVE